MKKTFIALSLLVVCLVALPACAQAEAPISLSRESVAPSAPVASPAEPDVYAYDISAAPTTGESGG
ncbi:MAG: hypothetical protein FWG06_04080, partial [Clostridiales bacterium]|nr:hypothetical protein [Clostridiales bacterium]